MVAPWQATIRSKHLQGENMNTQNQNDKATARPWQTVNAGEVMQGYSQNIAIVERGAPNIVAGIFFDVRGGKEVAKANAALIIKAVNEHAALVAVAEVNRKLAMLVLQSDFYRTGHNGEVKQAVDNSLLAQDNLAAVREGKKVQS
jgi:hypothetical protein